MSQIRQLAGMRGLMANPKGEIIERPIKANFMEGLTVLEYFISTHGARKGLADTALRTADSGYLTRRLVDVAQDVIIREADCGTEEFIELQMRNNQGDPNDNLVGRFAAQDVVTKRGRTIVEKGGLIDRAELADMYESLDVDAWVPVRSVLKCEAVTGVCQACYGRSMATGQTAQIGDAVGIIAAQSIGEPGTQLTMRTFHTGGVAGADITHGLPRVVELFEARKPKGLAQITEHEGVVHIEETDKALTVVVTDDSGEEHRHTFPRRTRLFVSEGERVEAGRQLNEGSLYPHDLLKLRGRTETERYLVKEVQEVYKSQGVDINDKHIELIVRQMLKKVRVDVIIGKLIPAATGLKRYRRIEIEPAEPLPRAVDDVGLLDQDEIAAELGLGDGDGLGGFGSAFDEDLASLEEIGAGGGDPGFAEELAELDVPDEEQ
jgi:DNA-directed RNA polymerase subunit beta'